MKVRARSEARICAYCRGDLDGAETRCANARCAAVYHAECWDLCTARGGSCAIFGCGTFMRRAPEVAVATPREPVEPATFKTRQALVFVGLLLALPLIPVTFVAFIGSIVFAIMHPQHLGTVVGGLFLVLRLGFLGVEALQRWTETP